MKRDLDLIRDILLQIENTENGKRIYVDQLVEALNSEYDFNTISYHVGLLEDSDYIVCERVHRAGTMIDGFIIYRMTNYGHDYLETVKDDSVYKETKSKLGSLFSNSSLEIVSKVASEIILSKINF